MSRIDHLPDVHCPGNFFVTASNHSILFLTFREEKRCRVREKELREKDILIQDNLIRFSSFLSQQDMRKTKDLEAAQIEKIVSSYQAIS